MIDAFHSLDTAEQLAYEAGREIAGQSDPEARFTTWVRNTVRNCGNYEMRCLKKAFGRGYQRLPYEGA